VVESGVVGDVGEAGFGHAHGAQAGRQSEASGEGGEIVGEGGVLGEAQGPAQGVVLVGGSGLVESEHGGQDHGVQRAVVQGGLLHAAQGVGEGVDRTQALLEGQAALQGRHHHLLAGIAVAAIPDRALDGADRTGEAIKGDRLGRRVVARREIGLHAMGDRIHAGGGGEPGRQAEGQLRVADGGLRDQMRADEAELAAVGQRDQRGAANFAAGPGSCRDRDHRRGGGRDLGDAAQDRGIVR
jgi:hypothetical protein